ITAQWWGSDPVASVGDDAFDPWYLDNDTWLLADVVSIGAPSVAVGWSRESNWQEPASDDVGIWRLFTRAGAGVPPGMASDCAFPQPIPEISGAMWLIIDGADLELLEQQGP